MASLSLCPGGRHQPPLHVLPPVELRPEWPAGSRVQRPLAGHLPGTVGLSSPQPGHGASHVVPLAGWLFQESLFGQEAL